ncbi:hypothetical protein [Kiloniella antarctica]|uniref:STAS domain-containing protein n=1 Tax=Kiloniella antarctica TaxID=1550907 RepID=A0ABW5BL25_9PROT
MSETEGPWHVEHAHPDEKSDIFICHQGTVCDSTAVAVVNDVLASYEVNSRRARISAAAPDLLEACQMALEVFSEVGSCEEQTAFIAKAIAKAEGAANA